MSAPSRAARLAALALLVAAWASLLPPARAQQAFAPAASPGPVLVISSGTASAYVEAQKGVIDSLLRAAPAMTVTSINLQTPEGQDAARQALAARQGLVVAIGTRASKLALARPPQVPLVYAMVLDPATLGLPAPGTTPQAEITGVAMDVTFEKQFELLRELVPDRNRVGVLYDPALSGEAVRRAQKTAEPMGLTLVTHAVRSDAEVMGAAGVIMPDVDAMWAIPDPTVLTSANAPALILTTLRSRKPLFAMSASYVRNGALAALAARPYAVGRRAGEMASSILGGRQARSIRPEMPPEVAIYLNSATAQRLGLTLPDEMLARAETVYPEDDELTSR